jgi:hypothetical protein
LNGVQVLGNKSEIETPLNYVRIAGGCAEGLEFAARLDGSFTTLSMESSDVTNLSLTINKSNQKGSVLKYLN